MLVTAMCVYTCTCVCVSSAHCTHLPTFSRRVLETVLNLWRNKKNKHLEKSINKLKLKGARPTRVSANDLLLYICRYQICNSSTKLMLPAGTVLTSRLPYSQKKKKRSILMVYSLTCAVAMCSCFRVSSQLLGNNNVQSPLVFSVHFRNSLLVIPGATPSARRRPTSSE